MGERSSIGTSGRLAYMGKISSTIADIATEMVEQLYVQESLYSLPGSVPSEPHNGLIREPLFQEDTCHRLEHTTSLQRQSMISKLN